MTAYPAQVNGHPTRHDLNPAATTDDLVAAVRTAIRQAVADGVPTPAIHDLIQIALEDETT